VYLKFSPISQTSYFTKKIFRFSVASCIQKDENKELFLRAVSSGAYGRAQLEELNPAYAVKLKKIPCLIMNSSINFYVTVWSGEI
jgi:hypothetical protein